MNINLLQFSFTFINHIKNFVSRNVGHFPNTTNRMNDVFGHIERNFISNLRQQFHHFTTLRFIRVFNFFRCSCGFNVCQCFNHFGVIFRINVVRSRSTRNIFHNFTHR